MSCEECHGSMDWDPDDCPGCVSASRALPRDLEFRPVDVVVAGRDPFGVMGDMDYEQDAEGQ